MPKKLLPIFKIKTLFVRQLYEVFRNKAFCTFCSLKAVIVNTYEIVSVGKVQLFVGKDKTLWRRILNRNIYKCFSS